MPFTRQSPNNCLCQSGSVLLLFFNNNELIYFSTNEKGIGYVKIIASQHIEPRKSVGLLKKNISYIKGKNDISLIYFIFF